MTERISHEKALRTLDAGHSWERDDTLRAYVRQQQALEADTVSRAEPSDQDVGTAAWGEAWMRRCRVAEAQLTALQAELATEKAAVQCYMADLETERARAEEAESLAKEARAETESALGHRNQLQADLEAELAGRAELRKRFGARDDETMPAFIERLAAANARVASLETTLLHVEDCAKYFSRMSVIEGAKPDGETSAACFSEAWEKLRSALSTAPQASMEQASPSPAAKRPVVERYTVGQVIDDELEARGGMTPALAEGLGATFGVNPQLFLNLALAVELDAAGLAPRGEASPSPAVVEAKITQVAEMSGCAPPTVQRVMLRAYEKLAKADAQPAPSPAVGDASACHDDDHLYPGDGPCNCGGEGSPMGMPQPHIKTCPQHPDYVPVDDEPAQPAPGGTERWVPKVGDRVRNKLNYLRGEVTERRGSVVMLRYDDEERAYECVTEALEPDHTPAEPQGRPDISECPKCGGTYTDEHEGPLCPPCDYVKEQGRPEQAGDRVDQLRADVARAFRALGLGGVSNHQVAEDAAAELEALRSQLRASEAECERLRQEVEDVRFLDEWGRKHDLAPPSVERADRADDGFTIDLLYRYALPSARYIGSLGKVKGVTESAARRAAVEYLKKERKDG